MLPENFCLGSFLRTGGSLDPPQPIRLYNIPLSVKKLTSSRMSSQMLSYTTFVFAEAYYWTQLAGANRLYLERRPSGSTYQVQIISSTVFENAVTIYTFRRTLVSTRFVDRSFQNPRIDCHAMEVAYTLCQISALP